MRNCLLLILLTCGATLTTGYKIGLFVPSWIPSQLIWTVRVAEELAKAGHKVTIIGLRAANITTSEPHIMKEIERWDIEAFSVDYDEVEKRRANMIFRDFSFYESDLREALSTMVSIFVDSCELLLQNKAFIERLKTAKFDLVFNHMGDFCGIGLTRLANIPTWIWLSSAQLLDIMAEYSGVPSPPSYVPVMFAESTDEMNFIERVKSFIGRIVIRVVIENMLVAKETELFRKYVDPNFPDLTDLAKACPLLMVNSNEMYNLPRPMLHKIIYIGGLGMTSKDAQPLAGDFKAIMDAAKHVVVMTFGSHVNTSTMPKKWKNAFLGAFQKFPDVQFIVRYGAKDLNNRKPANVHLEPWIPQSDLLQHKKTVALITHGGANSVQEAINAGVPLIAIPLFGDQPGNAKLVVKHGFGCTINKKDISVDAISDAINNILHNTSYKESVIHMRDMLMKKPGQPDRLLVKWTEFLAEFKDLPNFAPYGTQLNFIQYHCIDVIAFLCTILIVVIGISVKLFKLIGGFVCAKIFRADAKLKTQ